MATNDSTDIQMEDMTLIQLKAELRRRKMKTKTGVKADPIKRLQTVMLYEKEKDNGISDKTNDETDNGQTNIQRNQQETYVLTFKDVKDARKHI